ncbi:MAG: AbrB/MazE/SpoVT family DNA-binding domain-containing protein [Waterburya sp.]
MDYKAEVHKAGRITIPIELRKEFNIEEGDILTIRQENNELKIITSKQALDYARSLVKPYLSSSNSSVDDFLKWRKEETVKEERELKQGEIS